MDQILILKWVPVKVGCSNWVLMVIAGCRNWLCLSSPRLLTAILHVVTFALVTVAIGYFDLYKIAIII